MLKRILIMMMYLDNLNSSRFVLFTRRPVFRRLRRAFVLEQNLLSVILQSSLVLPLIASDDNGNDVDNDNNVQGVPQKTLIYQVRCNFLTRCICAQKKAGKSLTALYIARSKPEK